LAYERVSRGLTKVQTGFAWAALAAVAVMSATGCSLEEVNSDSIRTTGLYADILALASGDGETLVRVELAVGGDNGTTVNLAGDDDLVASAGGPPGSLVRRGAGRYELGGIERGAATESDHRLGSGFRAGVGLGVGFGFGRGFRSRRGNNP